MTLFSRRGELMGRNGLNRRECLIGSIMAAITAACSRPSLAQDSVGPTAGDIADLYVPDRIDLAIERGIESLLKKQNPDGSITDHGNATAMTSLSIMAMASIGIMPDRHTPRGMAMDLALEFVLNPRNQREGYFGERDGSRMYGHGITTLMLTEMLGMGTTIDQNQRMHDSLDSAIKVILESQAIAKPPKLQGGWRYNPTSRDSDLSVSVWQVMSLRSAKNDGMDVPIESIDKAVDYLQASYTSPLDAAGVPRDPMAGFAYTPSTNATFTMTAAGLLAMQTCGQYDSPLVAGAAKWLLEHTPDSGDRYFYYGMYYYAQGMHQVGGEAAEVAAKVTADELLKLQSDTGYWISHHGEERNNGIVYCTTLAILSLSVRYHYLPIYQR